MKMKLVIVSALFSLTFFSCDHIKQHLAESKKDTMQMEMPKTDSVKYTAAMVDNAKDGTCGMPVAAGIEDTVHYNNKVIGFCSKECKDDFMKDAKKNFTSVEWKK
jgi:YHS domain-containing protein